MNFDTDLENIEKVNIFIQGLDPENIVGNWSLSELIIHIWSWDLEMTRLLEAQIAGTVKSLDFGETMKDTDLTGYFQFEYQKEGMKLEEWNDMMISKYRDRSVMDLKAELNRSRQSLVSAFRKHIEYFRDRPEVIEKTISIWKHDLHHLKKYGFRTEDVLR